MNLCSVIVPIAFIYHSQEFVDNGINVFGNFCQLIRCLYSCDRMCVCAFLCQMYTWFVVECILCVFYK